MMQLLIDPAARPTVRHPAKYTDALLPTMARMLSGSCRILDPFGGTGKVFLLKKWLHLAQIEAIEIEPEWAAMHPKTMLGNALALPWHNNYFDAIVTSPTYANRMADSHVARDASRRNTYTHAIGHKLHPENSGHMQWGTEYKEFHIAAWKEARRVLCDNGVFILNIKDHIRDSQRIEVTDFHINTLLNLGFRFVVEVKIDCPGNGYGQNGNVRIPYESVIKFEKSSL